ALHADVDPAAARSLHLEERRRIEVRRMRRAGPVDLGLDRPKGRAELADPTVPDGEAVVEEAEADRPPGAERSLQIEDFLNDRCRARVADPAAGDVVRAEGASGRAAAAGEEPGRRERGVGAIPGGIEEVERGHRERERIEIADEGPAGVVAAGDAEAG